jgi:uncharacterized membrane protein YbhN (UPF0104 family)
MRLKKSWLWLLAASIGLSLALPLALGGLGQFKLLDRLSWWAALLFTLLMVVSWLFNSWRIRMLMRVGGRRVSWREAVLTTASAEFAGVTTPGGVGMPATYIFLFHGLGVGVPEAVGLEGLIVVTDLVFYVTVMPLAALILLFEVGAKPDVLHLVAVVMLVVVGAAAVLWNLGRCSLLTAAMTNLRRQALHLTYFTIAYKVVECVLALGGRRPGREHRPGGLRPGQPGGVFVRRGDDL